MSRFIHNLPLSLDFNNNTQKKLKRLNIYCEIITYYINMTFKILTKKQKK